MLFNSLAFLLFFPVVTALYFLLPGRFRTALLLVASSIFYAAFIPAYLLILLFLIVIDYWAGRAIEATEGKRRFHVLLVSILANGGMLFFFKYFNFFNGNLSLLSHAVGYSFTFPHLDILLPLGLSFHVFQSLSYTIEVYRKNVPAEQNFFIFALYVMFYPQLTAGPIERAHRLLPQLHAMHDFNYVRVVSGLRLMMWGFFKKVVIADQLGGLVDYVYNDPSNFPGTALVVATAMFAYEIYCDFSGYTDIARGAARVMGINLMQNFNLPYSATTVTEFWKRWHMSLTSWIRDYIFMPLAVRWRHSGSVGLAGGLIVAFLFSGLWHGASWMFVTWGLLHGIVLSLEFLTRNVRSKLSLHLPAWILVYGGRAYVFIFWCFTLVFFRAKSFDQALYILSHAHTGFWTFATHLFDRAYQAKYLPLGGHRNEYFIIFCSLALLLVVQGMSKHFSIQERFARLPVVLRWLTYTSGFWLIIAWGVFIDRQFIYFAF